VIGLAGTLAATSVVVGALSVSATTRYVATTLPSEIAELMVDGLSDELVVDSAEISVVTIEGLEFDA